MYFENYCNKSEILNWKKFHLKNHEKEFLPPPFLCSKCRIKIMLEQINQIYEGTARGSC